MGGSEDPRSRETTEAFVGFSSPATISIAGLFIVAQAVRDHGGLEEAVDRLMSDGGGGPRTALARLVPPVIGLSGVMNNTPLVATTGPIVRDGQEIAPIPPEFCLRGNDALVFVGRVDAVRDLLEHPGLIEAEQPQTQLLEGDGHLLIECVIASTSPLVGATLKQVSFRGRYGGAVGETDIAP